MTENICRFCRLIQLFCYLCLENFQLLSKWSLECLSFVCYNIYIEGGMLMSISKNIAKYRKIKGFTQEELGSMLGVTNQAVSKWECGVSQT